MIWHGLPCINSYSQKFVSVNLITQSPSNTGVISGLMQNTAGHCNIVVILQTMVSNTP